MNKISSAAAQKQLYLRFAISFTAAIGALLVGEYVYLGEYITTDENSYLF